MNSLNTVKGEITNSLCTPFLNTSLNSFKVVNNFAQMIFKQNDLDSRRRYRFGGCTLPQLITDF